MNKYIIIAVTIISIIIPLGYSQDNRQDKIETVPSGTNEILNNMKSYQETVERVSGKKFKSDVKGKIQSVEDFRNFVKKDLDKSFTEQSKWEQMALAKLGLLPKDYDLRKGIENLVVSQAGAYYDPASKYMYFVKLNMPVLLIETMVIHELTHALQDQYYDLEKLIKTADNSDKETAIKYLVEGEATYVMTIAQLEKMGMTFTADSPMLELSFSRYKNLGRRELLELSTSMADQYKETAPDIYESIVALKDTPDYLFWTLIAPYYRGAYSIHALVNVNEKQRNWQIMDQIYKNPPVSTEQMIHTEKLTEPRDNPSTVPIPTLDDWNILSENTIGEFGFWILYSKYLKGKANEASEGWDGDKYMLIQHNKTKDIALYLSTVWDSDNDAYESFNAYQKIISKKYPSAELKNTEKPESGQMKYSYTTADNKLIILTLKGNTWCSAEDIPLNIGWNK